MERFFQDALRDIKAQFEEGLQALSGCAYSSVGLLRTLQPEALFAVPYVFCFGEQ